MAKRYGELADALEQISLHLDAEGNDYMSSQYRKAASELRQVEFIPANPAELESIGSIVRNDIAEWRAFGELDKLQEFEQKQPHISNLCQIAKVGPVRADELHEALGVETIEDVKDLEDGELESVSGIGTKTSTTIRRSIAQQ